MRRLLIVGVLATARTASADGPITARLGLGLAADEWGSGPVELDSAPTYKASGVLELELGYKVSPELALTVRTAITTRHDDNQFVYCPDPIPGAPQTSPPVQWRARTIGVGVSYAVTRALWVAPWLGAATIALSGAAGASPMLAAGVDAGYDLATWGDHHLGAFASVNHGGNFRTSNDLDASPGEYQVAIGVAYRYW